MMIEDIELVANIQTKEDKIEATKNYKGETDNWYLNTFLPNFMTKNIPINNIKMPTLTQGIVNNKPLYTYYSIGKTDPKIPDSLRNHIFKSYYWLAGRCVESISNNSSVYVRRVASDYVGGNVLCSGVQVGFSRYDKLSSVRPIVCLQSGVQLTEYEIGDYNWKVNQE